MAPGRSELIERLECEQYAMPAAQIVRVDPDIQSALIQLVELCREALGG